MNIQSFTRKLLLLTAAILAGSTFCSGSEISLFAGQKPKTTLKFNLKAKPAADEMVLLKFDARLIGGVNSGWTHAVSFKFNGKMLYLQTRFGTPRIVNRSDVLISKESGKLVRTSFFKTYNKIPYLLFFATPRNSTSFDSRAQSDRDKGLDYVLDVSDLAVVGENTLELETRLPAPKDPAKKTELLFKRITLETAPALNAGEPKWDFDAVFPKSKQVTLITADKTVSKTITFPPVKPRRDMAVILHVDARLVTNGFSGWNPWFAIRLNGKQLDRNTSTGEQRLLRRGSYMQTKVSGSEKLDWWGWFGGKMTLMTLFAPLNTSELDPRIIAPRSEGYNYYLDVTDCVNYLEIGADDRIEKDQPNTIDILLHLVRANLGGKELPLVVRNINFLYIPKSALSKMRSTHLKKFPDKAAAAEITTGESQLKVAADGTVEVVRDKENFVISTQFSYPSEPQMKFNYLGDGKSLPSWKPVVKQLNSQSIRIFAESKDYKVERTIKIDGKIYRVTDVITNTSDKDLGMAIWIALGGNTVIPAHYRLAGQTGAETVNFFSVSNPSLFVPGKKAGAGIVAEDNVSRAQLEMQGRVNEALMGTAGVGIKKGASLKREWSIYAVDKPDYFAFINAVRRDWGANFTIPGPCSFSYDPSETALRSGVVMIPPWFEFDLGCDMPRDKYMSIVKPRIAAAKAEFGDNIFIMPRLEGNLVPMDCSKLPWGNEIPQRKLPRKQVTKGGSYGVFLSKAVTAKLDKATPYRDSIIRDANGCAMIDCFYPQSPWIHLMVQPETGNHRLKTILEAIDFMFDKVGFNSIYIDQFNPYTIGGFSDDRWDGYTVKLDEKGNIISRRYSYAIMGRDARAEIIRKVTNRGGIILTNGQPMSREELIPGHIAFQEMENDDVNPLPFLDSKPPEFRWQTISHLGTPVALGLRPGRYEDRKKRPNHCAEIQFKGLVTALRNGINYYIYSSEMPKDNGPDAGSFDVYNHLFPFTPVELNEGFIIGKERTITARSGKFTVKGTARPRCFRFNSRGRQEPESGFTILGSPGNWTVDVKLKDWCEVGVIEVRNQ